LLREDAVDALRRRILPLAAVVTPNLPEAAGLAAMAVGSREEMAEAAEAILAFNGLRTSFRQKLDGAWTVRFGPLPRDEMRAVLDRFAW
jgi:pyridoxal/pyridoxine/pyridoxamine kinase